MNKLTLKVLTPQQNKVFYTIDDEKIKFKKDKYGHYIYELETPAQTCELKVYKYLEVNSSFFWLWQMLFFFVSILGIFDRRLDKHCIAIEYIATITLTPDSVVTIRTNLNPNKKYAALTEANTEIVEKKNAIFFDKKAKKRVKTLKILKALVWVAVVFAAFFIIFNRS